VLGRNSATSLRKRWRTPGRKSIPASPLEGSRRASRPHASGPRPPPPVLRLVAPRNPRRPSQEQRVVLQGEAVPTVHLRRLSGAPRRRTAGSTGVARRGDTAANAATCRESVRRRRRMVGKAVPAGTPDQAPNCTAPTYRTATSRHLLRHRRGARPRRAFVEPRVLIALTGRPFERSCAMPAGSCDVAVPVIRSPVPVGSWTPSGVGRSWLGSGTRTRSATDRNGTAAPGWVRRRPHRRRRAMSSIEPQHARDGRLRERDRTGAPGRLAHDLRRRATPRLWPVRAPPSRATHGDGSPGSGQPPTISASPSTARAVGRHCSASASPRPAETDRRPAETWSLSLGTSGRATTSA
jgi:hypothetical protein